MIDQSTLMLALAFAPFVLAALGGIALHAEKTFAAIMAFGAYVIVWFGGAPEAIQTVFGTEEPPVFVIVMLSLIFAGVVGYLVTRTFRRISDTILYGFVILVSSIGIVTMAVPAVPG